MPLELARRGLLDRRRALLAWSIGIAAYVALISSIFPSVEGSQELDDLVESYPEALKSLFGLGGDLSSGPGFLDAELFSLMLPLLVLVLAIGSGARAFAGEEDAGRLELLLAYPLRRRDSVLAKGAAVAVEVLIVSAAATLVLAVLDPLIGLELSLDSIAAAVGSVAVLGVFFGWLALAVGAAVPSRALAMVVPATIAAGGYLVSGLHELVSWLEPFRFLSPTWIAGTNPLQNGVHEWGLVALLVLAAAVLAAGALFLERRDLKTP